MEKNIKVKFDFKDPRKLKIVKKEIEKGIIKIKKENESIIANSKIDSAQLSVRFEV